MPAVIKIFGRFRASIEPNADRPGVNCYIETGDYSASLECAADTGVLTNYDTEREVRINEARIEEITAWARQHGF